MMNTIKRSSSIENDKDIINDKSKFKTFRLKDFQLTPYISDNIEIECIPTKIKRENRLWRKNPLEEVSKSVKVEIKDIHLNVSAEKEVFKSVEVELKDILGVPVEEEPCSSINKYRSYVHDRTNKTELHSIPEVESPVIEVSESDDQHFSSKIQNNLINYLHSKKKAVPGFSFKFLESFATKSIIFNENPASLSKLPQSTNSLQHQEIMDKSENLSKKINPRLPISSALKTYRTKSLIIEKGEYTFSNNNKKSQSFSFGSLSKIERKCFKNIKDLSEIKKEDSDKKRSDRTFTMYNHPFFKNHVFAKDDNQNLQNVKRFNSLEEIPKSSKDILRNRSYNTFLLKNLTQVNKIRGKKELQVSNLTEKDKDEKYINQTDCGINVADDHMLFEEFIPIENGLRKISEVVYNKIDAPLEEGFSGFMFATIAGQSSIEPELCIMEGIKERKYNTYDKTLESDCNTNEIIIKENNNKDEPPKKHIYIELLSNIIPQIISDTIENVSSSNSTQPKVMKEKPQKVKSKPKLKKKINENKETKEKNKMEQENCVENEMKILETDPKIVEENTDVKIIQSNIEDVITKETLEVECDKSNEPVLKYEEKLKKRKSRYTSNFSYFNDIKSGNMDMFNINWKDEVVIPDQVKKTVLMYDAHLRQLTGEKQGLFKENLEVIELNKSLQKRNGVLLAELKQQKRETAFIKNQITVMLSRMQSIPDKLEQLETENTNLKAEINDLERTLDQRDQLFSSERQMNASLSEEIVKLESNSVNKELMKNVCEEFENLNDEYENLKKNLEETEDKLFEIVQDRDNLIKHVTLMEETLYKLKSENNYLIQNFNQISSGGMVDPINGIWNPESRDRNYDHNFPLKTKENESNAVDTKYSCRPEKEYHDHHYCRHSRHKTHSRKRDSSEVSSTSSSSYSESSSDYRRKHKKNRKHYHKHNHRKSHSHKSSHKKDKSRKNEAPEEKKPVSENQNQNANSEENPTEIIIKMPKTREELKILEQAYDKLQAKKDRMESTLSHIPINKGTSNSSNLTSMQEQESLERELDQCDKQLASLRKILRECKVFKSIPSMN